MGSFRIKLYKKLINYHNKRIRLLKNKIEKLWIKPNCTRCMRSDSPCVPNPWDCSGFVEKKNDRS